MDADVLIAGGGPAGLAAAIRAAQRGFRALVLERSAGPPDKACGEGLMPSGVRDLKSLGVAVAECAEFRGIRYVQEDGRAVEAPFRGASGLGIRRTHLAAALRERARECGAQLRHAAVLSMRAAGEGVQVETSGGALTGHLLVAADGLHSPLRRAAGLEAGANSAAPRYGVRRHFDVSPWTDFVEVHWAPGIEAYVTPVGARSVNVAFLGENGRFEEHLARFPALQARLAGAPFTSEARGAGPLLQRVQARHAERLALVGDAAGYVDAITGQGLSLAFAAAALLMRELPADLSADLRPSLRRYDRGLRASWLKYAVPARALVALSRRPRLRHDAIRSVAALPGAFGALVRLVGES